jgi:hypothetical protein
MRTAGRAAEPSQRLLKEIGAGRVAVPCTLADVRHDALGPPALVAAAARDGEVLREPSPTLRSRQQMLGREIPAPRLAAAPHAHGTVTRDQLVKPHAT